jgi:hypothetical protein
MINIIVETVAVITAILSIKFYGDGWKYSGYFGLFSQSWWIAFTYLNDHSTLYVLCVCMVCVHIRNIFKMNK